ncbi:MAG: PEP/pyruvate-binding domain-containing protein [Candidatus Micrarchaeota archaeon]
MKVLRKLVKQIHRNFKGIPLAVRSSAHGDCRGTGIYDSKFCFNINNEDKTLDGLVKAIKAVMVSEFSDSAIAFRKDLGLPGGIAVMIEPVFGQTFKKHHDSGIVRFGPLYGGFGYTSCSDGEGYVLIAAGLPTGTVKGEGLKIKESDERPLDIVQYDEYERLSAGLVGREMKFYASDATLLYVARNDTDHLEIVPKAVLHENLAWLFAKLKQLERLAGKPQYVEYAIAEKEGQVCVTILQIADADKKQHEEKEVVESEKTITIGGYVRGSGEVESDTVLFARSEKDIPLLRKLNAGLTDYVVVYVGDLTKSIQRRPIEYADINNARVLVETPGISGKIDHRDAPEGHFKGLLDTTKKIYMIGSEIDWTKLGEPDIVKDDRGGAIFVYHKKVRVLASEKQQKAIVEVVE